MSITVTPNLTSIPRFDLSISSTGGSTITAISVTVTANGVTTPTRVQPTTGPSPRVVSDYEAPWGVGVVYTAIVVSGAGTETFTASAATLAPTVPWIIHPTTPALSRVLDSGVTTSAGVASHGTVSRPATTTQHDIIGSKYRVITKSGPRAASRTSLVITTTTSDERDGILALVDDQTPLLIRVPASWGWDWEDGYYDVGQVDVDRRLQYGPDHSRSVALPLERVDTPAGTQQSVRTYADLLAGFGTYSAVAAAYATYTDALTDTRH